MLHVVLFQPEIAPNTGNIGRLCALTRCRLHLIHPLGFVINDRNLRRAGMDYWRHVAWHRWASWKIFEQDLAPNARLWFIESGGPQLYTAADYAPDDYLVFGRETAGLLMRKLSATSPRVSLCLAKRLNMALRLGSAIA